MTMAFVRDCTRAIASYISAVLYSLVASFIDVLSLTVQCRPCSFGKALHI